MFQSVICDFLRSADCAWEESDGGHDWREACEAARKALSEAERLSPPHAENGAPSDA